MNILSKKRLMILSGILLIIVGSFFMPSALEKYRWYKNKRIIKAYAQELKLSSLGIPKVQLGDCSVSCNGGCCIGGANQSCAALLVSDCPLCQEISGTKAGGDMSFALATKINIGKAGIKDGGPVIGAFLSAVMPNSPNNCMAGEGGCVGSCCSDEDVDSEGFE